MEEQVDTDVAIIGAGSTGLLLAQGLKSAGIPFRIFERHAADHVSREWSMSLHWGTEFLSRILPPHLRDRLDEINVDPEYDFSKEEGFVQCNGETGEVILVMPGTMPRRVSRRKLRTLMAEGIDVEYGKGLAGMAVQDANSDTSRVAVSLTDNTTITCRILVGCDGSKSYVRQTMVNDDKLSSPIPTPYTILNFPYTYPAEAVPDLRQIHPVFKVSYHPKLNCTYALAVLDTAKAKTTGEMMFQNLLSWQGSPTAEEIREDPSLALKRLREYGAQFATPFASAAAYVADDAKLFADRAMQWDPRPIFSLSGSGDSIASSWNGHSFGGRVTLAGDAAHAMLPYRGQGLNNALEDAARLVPALISALKEGTQSVAKAIADYEKEAVDRGGKEVEMSGKAAVAGHDWEVLRQSPIFKFGANKAK